MSMMPAAIYHQDPVATLDIDKPLAQLAKASAKPDWIKSQIPTISNVCTDKIHNAELGDLYFEKLVDPVLSAKKARETIWASRSNIEFKKIAKDVYLKHGSRKRQNIRF